VRLYNIYGKLVSKNVSKHLIDWDKKSRSKFQFKVKQLLRPYWQNQIVYEEFPVYGSRMRVDILNATKRIAIEVNGRQHSEFVPYFHKSRAEYLKSIKRDHQKTEWLEKNGFNLLEIEEKDLNPGEDFFLNKLKNLI
jgi:very-short-patch-repair endonuclease